MLKFITTKPFWVNLLAALALFFLVIFIILQLLGWLTKHGEYLTVPAVKGKNTQEAIKLLESKGFEVAIQDSVYTDTLPKGTVIKQLPDPNATVKINRTVFITVNRYVPPMISMPSLEGKPLNFALEILARNHLQLGDTVYRADFMKGSVIEQQYRGQRIMPGDKVQWGSRISLVISRGLEETNLLVPDFLGMTYGEAKAQLDSMGILVTPVPTADVRDTLAAFIYKQNPPHFDENKRLMYIKAGMVMDLFLSPVMINLPDSVKN
ncbi:MAG: PASTA domain-containing protein [Ferruginibacter sp.]